MIPQELIDTILEQTPIKDLVGEYVNLKKAGVNYRGLCPFHEDRTPSFYVSPVKGVCKCFSCGKGGNAIHFYMKMEGVSFRDALIQLGNRAGIETGLEKEYTDAERVEFAEKESMVSLNEWMNKEFIRSLKSDNVAKGYFQFRGIPEEIIDKFQLGYCPEGLSEKARRYFSDAVITEVGLGMKRYNQMLDKFAGRVIFPWLSVSGKVIAFGGRVLDTRTKGVSQKYINSPESKVFSKSKELYGLYQAKRSISKCECVYMVEGYTDVISMHIVGIENVVANSGTALTKEQVNLLHRFTENIVLIYDGDEAGIHAALRGSDMLMADGMNVKILLLPDGDDPDSFSKRNTKESFLSYVKDNQEDFVKFQTRCYLKDIKKDPVKRIELVGNVVRSISLIPSRLSRAIYIDEVATLLSMDKHVISQSVEELIANKRITERKNLELAEEQVEDAFRRAEKEIISVVVHHGKEQVDGMSVTELVFGSLSEDEICFSTPLYVRMLNTGYISNYDDSLKFFINNPDAEIGEAASCMEDVPPDNIVKMINEYKLKVLDREINRMDNRMNIDPSCIPELFQERNNLVKLRLQLNSMVYA